MQHSRDAIQNAFACTRWDASYPMPQFHGRREKNLKNIASRVEDWFAHFEIADGDKVARFKEILFGHPRTWIDTVHLDPGSWDTTGDPTRLKPKFLATWSVKGRTQDALYAEWQSLSFDPGKDDIEEFMTDIKNIASQLNYPDAAQVMVIKGMLPIKIYNKCLNINALNDLKDFLIKVVDNPRIKNRYSTAKDSEPSGSAFSIVKNVDTPSLGAATEMGELISKIDSIELSLHSLNNKGSYKPRVSPQQTRPFNCNPHQSQNEAKAPPEIPVIIIQIDIRTTGEVRQNSSIMEEVDFMPALMLDAPE